MSLQIVLGFGLIYFNLSIKNSQTEKWSKSKVPYRYTLGFAIVLLGSGLAETIAPYFVTNPQTASLIQTTTFTIAFTVLALMLWFFESRAISAKTQRIQAEQDVENW